MPDLHLLPRTVRPAPLAFPVYDLAAYRAVKKIRAEQAIQEAALSLHARRDMAELLHVLSAAAQIEAHLALIEENGD